jgi:hypothetical protein
VAPPSPTLRYLRRAFRRGRFEVVRAEGDELAEALADDPRRADEMGELALLMGAAHAAADRLALAEAYLQLGLDRWVADHDSTVGELGGVGDDGDEAAGPADRPWTRPSWADTPAPATPPEALPADLPEAAGPYPTPWLPLPPTPAPDGHPPAWPPLPGPPPPAPAAAPTWGEQPWNDPPWADPPRAEQGWAEQGWAEQSWAEQGWAGQGAAGQGGRVSQPPPGAPWAPPSRGAPYNRGAAPDAWSASSLTTPPPPTRAPFVDWCELLLCEVHLRTGRTTDAADRLVALVEPHRDVATRFAATRAQATVATLAGHHERAHHLLNTATGLAARVPSRFRGTLVERDRAVVLAREGRLNEALAIAERIVPPLVRPVAGAYQRWSRMEGASLALALARHAALAADEAAARRMLHVAADAIEPLGHAILGAHLLLVSAVVGGPTDDPDRIEEALSRAAAVFERSGDRPAAASVVLEHGRLAHRRGLGRSARPLYRQAAAELRACGHPAEARLADTLLAALDAGAPAFRYGNVP